jgi:hypothetical protein
MGFLMPTLQIERLGFSTSSAATGLLMQVSNFGAPVGPPIAGALVSAGGWPAAAWMTSLRSQLPRRRAASCMGAKGVDSPA